MGGYPNAVVPGLACTLPAGVFAETTRNNAATVEDGEASKSTTREGREGGTITRERTVNPD